ncbi:MAG: zinc ribbon domain-containing protein, partial [Spirochaetales bacterium]|nr:zinc ribbon domain-containing protein [Spirochaetales bacterium]
MALVTCPECGKSVSDSAEACPHCGFVNPGNSSVLPGRKKSKGCLFWIVVGLIIFFAIGNYAAKKKLNELSKKSATTQNSNEYSNSAKRTSFQQNVAQNYSDLEKA